MPLPPPLCRGREICREGAWQGLVLSSPHVPGRPCLPSPLLWKGLLLARIPPAKRSLQVIRGSSRPG